jgi:hypothetical protein
MTSESEGDEKLQPTPRSLGRWRLREEGGALFGADSVGERRAEIFRRAFGVDRVAEREAMIGTWRKRTAVSHAAIRAVLDGGPWEDDAFVALEEIAGPTETREAFLSRDPDLSARLRVVSELLGAASVLLHEGLRLPDPAQNFCIDGYGQPKLAGLEDASASNSSASNSSTSNASTSNSSTSNSSTSNASASNGLDPRILELAASIDPNEARAARIRGASPADIEGLARELANVGKVAPSSFASDAARGERALSQSSRGRQMQIALFILAIALLVGVALAIASR